jgi:hypothetical protein
MASNPMRIPSGKPFNSAPPAMPPMTGSPSPSGAGDQGEPGDGTQQSGYVTPDLGPFECDNCTHFQAPDTCDHPEVVSDPEVNGQVEAKGCCNFFKSLGGSSDQQTAKPQADSQLGAAAAGEVSDGNPGGYGG